MRQFTKVVCMIVVLLMLFTLVPPSLVLAVDNDSRVPVLFIHGYGDNGAHWESSNFYKDLLARGIKCRSVDYKAYNNNDVTSDAVMKIIDNDIGVLLKNSEVVDVVVHSMGGLAIRWYLLQHPDMRSMVRKVTFIGTPNHGSPTATLNRITDMIEAPDYYFDEDGKQQVKAYEDLYKEFENRLFDWDTGLLPTYENWLHAEHGEVIRDIETQQYKLSKPAPNPNIGVPVELGTEDYRYSTAFERYVQLMLGRWNVRKNQGFLMSDTPVIKSYPAPGIADDFTKINDDGLKEYVIDALTHVRTGGAQDIVQDRLMLEYFQMADGLDSKGKVIEKKFVANPFLYKLNNQELNYRVNAFMHQTYFPQYNTISTVSFNGSALVVDALVSRATWWTWENNDGVVPVSSVWLPRLLTDKRVIADSNVFHSDQMGQTDLLKRVYDNPLTTNKDEEITLKFDDNNSGKNNAPTVLLQPQKLSGEYSVMIESNQADDVFVMQRDGNKMWRQIDTVHLERDVGQVYRNEYKVKPEQKNGDYVFGSASHQTINVSVKPANKVVQTNTSYFIEPIISVVGGNRVFHSFRVYGKALDNQIETLDESDFLVGDNGNPIYSYSLHKSTKTVKSGDAIMLALDYSGSMEGIPKILSMNAASDFINGLENKKRKVSVGTLNFATQVTVLSDFTTNYGNAANSVFADQTGGTALYDAIIAGSKMLNSTYGRKTLIVMTDGTNTSGDSTQEQAISTANNSGVSVSIVCLGGEVNRDVISTITSRTRGQAFYTYDPEALAKIYDKITTDINTVYTLDYPLPAKSILDKTQVGKIGLTGARSNEAVFNYGVQGKLKDKGQDVAEETSNLIQKTVNNFVNTIEKTQLFIKKVISWF